jgi:pimeloyl-ACP methyl ester carboxylesterase
MAAPRFGSRELSANGVEFTALEVGSGPLALCLHGFPDSAHTWRHLLPRLADAGFHAVAPFMRGYAPTGIPADGCYSLGALVADANALHEVLEADETAVLIGHDWGAEAGYGAAAHSPERWRRFVSLSIPPLTMDAALFGDYGQIKRFFYMYFFQLPVAEEVVAADGMAFIDRLWADWSPGYDAAEDLSFVKDCLAERANLSAAIEYYRAGLASSPADNCAGFQAEHEALAKTPPQPTLYLHGAQDGCIGADLVGDAQGHLSTGSRASIVDGTGHFLQLERPDRINEEILAWVQPLA